MPLGRTDFCIGFVVGWTELSRTWARPRRQPLPLAAQTAAHSPTAARLTTWPPLVTTFHLTFQSSHSLHSWPIVRAQAAPRPARTGKARPTGCRQVSGRVPASFTFPREGSNQLETYADAISRLQEPEGFRPATPPPTVKTYARRKFGGVGDIAGPDTVEVGLVSGHPLWGKHL